MYSTRITLLREDQDEDVTAIVLRENTSFASRSSQKSQHFNTRECKTRCFILFRAVFCVKIGVHFKSSFLPFIIHQSTIIVLYMEGLLDLWHREDKTGVEKFFREDANAGEQGFVGDLA